MNMKKIHITDRNANLCWFVHEQGKSGGDNRTQLAQMKAILKLAIDSELTETQKNCLIAYYSGSKQKEIAAALGLAPSTVCRHIQSAKRKLGKLREYYEKMH